jgi:hypothetical protein
VTAPDSLSTFLAGFHALRSGDAQPSVDRLTKFLEEIGRKFSSEAVRQLAAVPQDSARLSAVLAAFHPLHEAARRKGEFIDVWRSGRYHSIQQRFLLQVHHEFGPTLSTFASTR